MGGGCAVLGAATRQLDEQLLEAGAVGETQLAKDHPSVQRYRPNSLGLGVDQQSALLAWPSVQARGRNGCLQAWFVVGAHQRALSSEEVVDCSRGNDSAAADDHEPVGKRFDLVQQM